jgi:peptidoglycan/xylan/chitin deacetylase (PgdA/CDA1 family)
VKKKKVIIFICIIFILGIGLLSFSIYHNKEVKKIQKQEEIRLAQEKKIKEDNIEKIDNEMKPFLNSQVNETDNDDLTKYLNGLINTHNKINTLDSSKYKITMESLNNLSTNKNNLENEIKVSNEIKFNDNLDDILSNYQDYEQEEIKTNYNNSNFITTEEDDLNKVTNYIMDLTNNLKIINYFINNQDEYFVIDNQIIYKNNEFYTNLINLKVNLPLKSEESLGKKIPILMYHGVLDIPWGISSLFVKVSELDSEIKYLHDNNYTCLTISQIPEASNYSKPIFITFDDAYSDVYLNAFPILKKYNCTASVYVILSGFDDETYVNKDMVKEMSLYGIEIGSHTLSHNNLGALSKSDREYNLMESQKELQDLIGKKVRTIAYPYGSYGTGVMNSTSLYYDYALTTVEGVNYSKTMNNYALKRLRVSRSMGLQAFINKVS